ncbi:hypothetical protein AAY473_036994 [Plecturocebus cupreus]
MLVPTPGQLALRRLISYPSGSAGATGCCIAPAGRGWLPLSQGPGGTHGPEAAAAAPLVATGKAWVPAAASEAAMAPAQPLGPDRRLRKSYRTKGGSQAEGQK